MRALGGELRGPTGAVLPLSGAVEAGGTVYVSGQLAMSNGRIVGDDVATQTPLAIDAIEALLEEASLELADVARADVWLTRLEDYAAFNQAYASRFSAPYPARATVVSALAVPGALVEIDAIAVRGRG